MTATDRMEILRRAVKEHGQTGVARRIGKSSSTVSMVVNGKYPNPESILELVAAEFGAENVECPVMGEVPLARCVEERSKPYRATNSQRRQLLQACPDCPHNRR